MRGRGRKGFTLVEALAAVLVVTLLTSVIAAGTSVAVRIYSDSLFVSESDLLASTVDAALGDLLRYAKAGGGDPEDLENADYGIYGGHFLIPPQGEDHGGHLMLSPRPESPEEEHLLLVSDGAYSNLMIKDFQLTYSDRVFSGAYTISDAGGSREKTVSFAFRTLAAD